MAPNRALEAALALARAPSLARAMRLHPLPEGLILILQMLAGDLDARTEARELTGLAEDHIVAIAELYVLRVMLFRGASPRRALGVEPGVDRSQIRRHMGYLMSWLHPDKGSSAWRAAFARRVLDAWQRIDKEEDETSQSPSLRSRIWRPLFLIPWIATPPERLARVRLVTFWRRLMKFAPFALILFPWIDASQGSRSSSNVLSPAKVAIAGSTGACPEGRSG